MELKDIEAFASEYDRATPDADNQRSQPDFHRRYQMETPVMKLDEVADLLRCHRSTIYRLIKRGEIPCWQLGSDWRFNREAIEDWMRRDEAKK